MAQRNRAFGRSSLQLTHPNAAGIDVGSARHFVAVPPDRDDEPVREFTSFTEDLERLADWLQRLRDRDGSDGIDRGVLDTLVRVAGVARPHRVSGQCAAREERLGAQVGRAGLPMAPAADELRFAVAAHFDPSDGICALRSIMRQRDDVVVATQGQHMQHMQKALSQMNIQLANVICRRGRRDRPEDLARDHRRRARPTDAGRAQTLRIQASAEEIAMALHGNWRAEHLFALTQAAGTVRFVFPGSWQQLRRPSSKACSAR